MTEETLFPLESTGKNSGDAPAEGVPRFQQAQRNQVEIMQTDLDSLLDDEHQARTVWSFVERADLSLLYKKIHAYEGGVGRSPIDPKILLALWLYATLDGVGSARALARLSEDHIAYRWICGGVSVNYHTLADFRSKSGDALNELLTESVACLRTAGAVTMMRVAHDGMRVRANAGGGSFRRKEKLEHFLKEAEQQVKALRDELDEDPSAGGARVKAARQRVAEERLKRVKEALEQYPGVHAKRKKDKDEARVSVTDPDARRMHMADGGFRPAYNVQFTTDTTSQMIIEAQISQSNSDGGQLRAAVERIEARHKLIPKEVLADGGFAKGEDVERLASLPGGCTVYMPVPADKTGRGGPAQPRADEPMHVTAWRARMETEEARTIYKERAATAECVNALARNRGLQQFPVRGVEKVRAVLLLFAVAHNLMRMTTLRNKK